MSTHRHDTASPVAVLLINLGTPDAPTLAAVRRYLAEFLSDPRVVELPAWLWQIVLRLFILPLRARLAATRYAAIWSKQGAPLRIHTQAQTEHLREWLHRKGYPVVLEYAMRYGTPAIAAVLERLVQAGAERVLIVPLYPQYSAASTASAFDAVYSALKRLRNQPALRTIKHYADDDGYIGAMARHIRRYWEDHGTPDFAAGDRLLLSFHGLPARASKRGDPYEAQCQKTAALLGQALGLTGDACQLTFQSRFGPQPWLQPYTAATLKQLGTAGVRRVDVFCPGFTADCLETLEEIGIAGRTAFLAAGGHEYHALPCLNASAEWIESLGQLVVRNLQGWEPHT